MSTEDDLTAIRDTALFEEVKPAPASIRVAEYAGRYTSEELDVQLEIVARDGNRIVGTVQIILDMPPNQQHRADIAKMMVHPDARRQGIARALMVGIEKIAHEERRSLLVLDTASGDAERLYARNGWQRCGVIPGYAMWPQGGFCDTTIFWKRI